MRSVGCKRTNAVIRKNKEQISDWIGTRLFVCAFASGIISSTKVPQLFAPFVPRHKDHTTQTRGGGGH